jgi:hypothetical protein
MASHDDENVPTTVRSPLRLRIPAALAVTVVGGAATVAMSFGGCQEEGDPPIPDAGRIFQDIPDSLLADAAVPDDPDGLADAATEVPPDAAPPG